jgi:hypothetical protein
MAEQFYVKVPLRMEVSSTDGNAPVPGSTNGMYVGKTPVSARLMGVTLTPRAGIYDVIFEIEMPLGLGPPDEAETP